VVVLSQHDTDIMSTTRWSILTQNLIRNTG